MLRWMACVVMVTGAAAHTSRLPGRFDKPDWNGPAAANGCDTVFSLGSDKFNVSFLQVQSAPKCLVAASSLVPAGWAVTCV